MPRTSAGILLYRLRPNGPDVLLGHMGGPFWAKKDDGAWSIPKGEHGPDEDPLAVALSVLQSVYEEADRELEAAAIAWLAVDPEHWPIFRLVVLEPWQQEPGQWREEVPRWVRTLGTNTTLAHFQQDPFGRQRVVDC